MMRTTQKKFRTTHRKSNSFIAYHATSENFTRFDIKTATQGIIWFSTDFALLARGESGARGSSRILKVKVTIKKPAGWDEYKRLTLMELKKEKYDGVILRDKGKAHFNGFVFRASQIKILGEAP